MKIKLTLLYSAIALLLSQGCSQNDENSKLANMEIAVRAKIIDSMNTVRKIDSMAYEYEKLIEIDSIIRQENKKEKSLSTLYDSLKASVVTVTARNSDEIKFGTAFFINKNGYLLTNFHVLDETYNGFIETSNGLKYEIIDIIRKDKENDWIIFKVNNKGDKFQELNISTSDINIGDKCFAIGNPLKLKLTMSEGIISGLRDNNNLIQNTTQITHGSSGGPLFNSKGELIGITTAGFGDADLNFAINLQNFKSSIALIK